MQAIAELKKHIAPCDYTADKKILKKFILFYAENGVLKYQDQLMNLQDNFILHMDDLGIFDESGLIKRFQDNAYSYMGLTAEVIDEILEEKDSMNTTDPFLAHRMIRFQEKFPNKKLSEVFPRLLLREYVVNPISSQLGGLHSIRYVRAEHIGRLIRVRGIVTRVSMIKPCIRVVTYVCESCGSETYQQVHTDVFDLLEECTSEKCRIRNIRGTLTLLSRGSKFQKYQSVHIQELTADVPQGNIPRTMKVECYESNTGVVRPGECVIFDGVFLPKPYHGIRKLKAGLLNDTYLHCTHITLDSTNPSEEMDTNKETNNNNDIINNLLGEIITRDNDDVPTSTLINNLLLHTDHTKFIDLLVDSFAPEIFGMKAVKKGLLLMLAGAPPLKKEDGLNIRGDINILLLGDPGIAKSQLLKTAIKLSKRGVYTTGRGCSGVGLTASVMKDPVTNEMILEGGALVLSDMGVCCIDELDKMNEIDRAAIHEVMEQQRVSISKAGINTTLNARCSVLGAANPIRGRYNPKKSVEHNIGLPVSLISRFDVLCVLRDDADTQLDNEMANHITNLHIAEDDAEKRTVSYEVLRNFITYARGINPVLRSVHKEKLVESYMMARKTDNVTPRYLLSLIRLSLASARINLREEVNMEDVEDAISLLDTMKVPREVKRQTSLAHAIYNYINGLARDTAEGRKVLLSELFEGAPFTREQIEDVISDFESSGIWMRNNEEIVVFN